MYIFISLGLAPKSGTPELHGLTLYLTFGGIVKLFSQVATPFYHPTNNESGFDSQHLVPVFLLLIILVGVKYLTVGFKKLIYNLHAIKSNL